MTTRPLLDVLQERLPDSSKTTLRNLLQNDRVRVNGSPERDAKRAVAGEDAVEIVARTERIDPRVRILFEDADLIAIDKAEGLLTVPTEEVLHETAETILSGYTTVHHVHRLDRDTSGVLVFAKNTWMRDRLQKLFAAHDIERVYVAIVHGKLREPAGTFRSFLAEDRNLRVRSVADPAAGKEAVTHYRTIASGRRYSIVEVTLETGRRNQIRVHFAEAGHPVLGDERYRPELAAHPRWPHKRLALHARLLGFEHPITHQPLRFEADLPRELAEFLRKG